MALELKPTSRWWYARFLVNGKLRRVNLGVRVEGARPGSITREGDRAFERSRVKALAAHEKLHNEVATQRSAEEYEQRVMEIKLGSRVEARPVADVPELWAGLPRKARPSRGYLEDGRRRMRRFVDFIAGRHPGVTDLHQVRAEHMEKFFAAEDERGVAARTWNVTFGQLKAVFARHAPESLAYTKHLRITRQRREETIHREPFTGEELSAVLEAAASDPLIRSLIVLAVSTGMRRGDCALLQWRSVDLSRGLIAVRTAKTGKDVRIPMLPELRAELEAAREAEGDKEYVWPEAAELYRRDQTGLNNRLKRVLARAGFVDERRAGAVNGEAPPPLPVLPPEELQRRGLEAIAALPVAEKKRATMRAVFLGYTGGKSLPAVARELGVSKGTVSGHLHAVETALGAAVLRPRTVPPEVVRGGIHGTAAGPRLKRGSTRGWHAFRTTFITRALAGGMPAATLQKITGHDTLRVVLENYYHPDDNQMRAALERAMPSLLDGKGPRSRDEQAREILERMTARTWRADRRRLLELMKDGGNHP